MKKNVTGIIWGICVVLLGVFTLLKILNLFTIDIFFEGWWTLFIIIPSLIGIIFDKDKYSSVFFFTLGVLLLLATNKVLEYSEIFNIMICIGIILTGVKILLTNIYGNNTNSRIPTVDSKGLPNYAGVFGGASERISKTVFKGCSMQAIFGSVDLDLRDAIIKEDVYINSVNIFGGSDIKVSNDINVVTSGTNIFGGTDSNKRSDNKETEPTIYIKTVCIFGGVDIK